VTSGLLHAGPVHSYRFYDLAYQYVVVPEEVAIMGYGVPTWEVSFPEFRKDEELT